MSAATTGTISGGTLTFTPNYLHYHVNDSKVNNQFASKLIISCDLEDEENLGKSKVYICDLNFMYPDQGNQIASLDAGPTQKDRNDYNKTHSYDAKVAGTLGSGCYIITDSAQHPNSVNCPVVKIDNKAALTLNPEVLNAGSTYRYRNSFISSYFNKRRN